MSRLIEKFASTLGASQRANVNTLLAEGNIRGEVRTFDQFKSRLEEFLGDVNLEAVPLTAIADVTANQLVSSALYNDMVRLIRLDLETVYTEVDNVCKIVDVHRAIQEKKIKDIRDSLAALDSQISTLELLSNDLDYGAAQFNTFNAIGAGSLSKLSPQASSLYIDPRTAQNLINSIYEANVDAAREGLTLPLDDERAIVIQAISVEKGSDSTESDLAVDPDDNGLDNILEPNDGLYWVRSILLLDQDIYGNAKSPPSDGVTVRVRLDLSGFQEINSITLVPFTDSAFYIDSISYIDVDGGEFTILATPTAVAEQTTLTFSRIVTNTVYIDIRQPSYSELLDFYYSSAPADVAEIQSLATTSGISDMEIGGGGGQLYGKGFFYTMGFDYIGLGLSNYRDIGIYVSEPLSSLGIITEALVTASVEYSTDDAGLPQDAIEFSLAKLNYDASGLLVNTEIFPVIYESGNIEHEELVLASGLGQTRFFPDISSLVVSRDFTSLIIGTDYTVSINGQDFRSSLADLIALDTASGVPQKLQIRILDPLITSVYTVSYTPTTAVNSNQIVLTGDSNVEFYGRSVRFNYSPDTEIVRSDIYTVIMLRTLNYTAGRETPIVFEYSTKISEV
ncbi:MAG: hypothetical protein ACXABY_00280 [Candidatus Thorarchaeota archaeon]|jgi:hypothetical protein